MAWIRWRGNTAHLMVTDHHAGKTTQRYLGSLGGAYAVTASERARIAARHPDVVVDWAAIDDALAAGPPGSPPLTVGEWDAARVEHQLREWTTTLADLEPMERQTLTAAAAVLQLWRARQPQSAP